MAKNDFQARVLARLDQEVSNFRQTGGTPFERRVQARMLAQDMPEEERRGFLQRVGQLFLDPDFAAARNEGASAAEAFRADAEAGAFSPRDRAQIGAVGAGIADPIIGAAQAVAQIPGLFTNVELPTDKAANYLERLRLGLTTRAETAAITAGMDPVALADAHLMGEIVGYTVPTVASLKAARLLTGIRGPVISLQRNFKLDSAAGLIFGSTLLPEEELQQRALNTLRESGLFGVGGLMINGLVFGATGMKFARASALQKEADLVDQLQRIGRGERVVIDQDADLITQVMSEEGFLATSPEAYALLENRAFDEALVQGVASLSGTGLSRGFVRSLGTDFQQVSGRVAAFRETFPQFKFDIISRETAVGSARTPPGRRVFHGTDVNFTGTPSVGNRPGLYLSESKRLSEIRATDTVSGTPRIFEARINPKRTLDLDKPASDFVQLMEQQATQRLEEPARLAEDGFDFVQSLTNTRTPRQAGDIVGDITEQEILSAARSLGYDSVKFKERVGVPGSTTWVVLDDAIANFVTRTARGGKEFDVHFGLTGLNNQQRAQLAREGRYAGQMVQKGDAVYQYVRQGKEGRLVVQTVDGRTTTLKPEGVTDLPQGVEEIPLPSTGQALYEDFRAFAFGKIREAGSASGSVSETDLVRFIRERQVDLEGTRAFESPGAITHPAEIGYPHRVEILPGSGSEALTVLSTDAAGQQVARVEFRVFQTESGQTGAEILDMVGGPGLGQQGSLGISGVRDLARQAAQLLREQEGIPIQFITAERITGVSTQTPRRIVWDVDDLIRQSNTVEGFQQRYLREGAQGNGLLQPDPIRRFDDAFEGWLRERNLSPNATDAEAFRQNFAHQMQRDIWDLLPKEDAAVMKRIQDETFRLIDAEELPFEVLAGSKGFHVNRPGGQEVVLRDINTGARLHFANQEAAENGLRSVVRAEKDSLFDFMTPGHHGGQALTVGFDPTDGVFTFETNIAPDEIFKFLPTQSITNRRDFLIELENVSKVPLFTEGFAKIDEGLLRMQNRLEPVANRIGRIWKGLNRNQRKQVAEFWTSIEGSDLSGVALTRAARNAGLNSKQIVAFNQARQLFDFGAEQMGLPESRFISNYYSRIRPAMLADGRADVRRLLSDDPIALREFEFWAEMQRTGELSQVELDPEIVMHKYFRSLFYKQEVAPFEPNIRRMMGLRIRDLTPEQQRVILQRSKPGTDRNSFLYPEEIRGMLQEYMNNVRGDSRPGFASARRFGVRMFSALGIDIDPRVVDELYNTFMSMPYGAAIGLRAVLMNRNATQNLWTMYTRVGGRFGSESLAAAMTQTGYDEAVLAGAIREVTAALPEADAIFQRWFTEDIARGSGPLSHAAAAVIRRAVRAGRVSRNVSQKFLVPYGSGDQVNRAWAYHWQKMHTAEKLADFDAGRLDWDGFLEDGLPFFSDSVKRGFQDRMKRFGREQALQWVGKQAADEAHFIYGAGATPTWMQTFYGKLFGIFGQWPLWAKQLYVNRVRTGSPKQIAQFWARTAAITGAFANMSIQSGVSMWNWVAPASLGFSGGPAVDMAITARDIWSGPLDQKASSTKRLAQQVGSLALPGQLFYSEFSEALDQSNPAEAGLRLTLGRAADQGNFNWDFILDPSEPGFTQPEETFNPSLIGLPTIPDSGGRR